MKKRGEILCIIVILRGTKMEIDNLNCPLCQGHFELV